MKHAILLFVGLLSGTLTSAAPPYTLSNRNMALATGDDIDVLTFKK